MRIKVAAGTFGGGAQVYAMTVPGAFIFGGTYTNVAKNNNWQEFTVNLDAPMTPNTGYDPTQVIVFGVQLNTGAWAPPATVTFIIDSFLDPSPEAGGAGAGEADGRWQRWRGRQRRRVGRKLARSPHPSPLPQSGRGDRTGGYLRFLLFAVFAASFSSR